MADIEKNILQVKKDIEESEFTFCREKNSVMLIAVSKTHSVEKIKKLIAQVKGILEKIIYKSLLKK